MLNVHLSNRFEALLDLLTAQAREHPGDVFTPLTVIVPSAAVQRAVTLHMAGQLGVCANVKFNYPAAWIWRQIARVIPGVGAASPFDPNVLVWRVYRAFGDAEFIAHHPRLAAYVGRSDDVMRFELAARTAELLEQYITYRPEWTARWATGHRAVCDDDSLALADETWQAALWRRIAKDLSLADEHPAFEMIRALELGQGTGLPASVHVIGLPSLPPLYVGVLQQLGRWMDVHVYSLNPCQAYWFEVVSERRLSWLASRGQAVLVERGHRLLSDWGQQTQAFLASLINIDGETIVDDGLFHANRGHSLLAALQNSILELEDLQPSSVAFAASDRSIEVHVCHSATRELEVLQDFLLGLFASDESLSPADVLVATPDLQAMAPLIQAVFGAVPTARRIPFTITGLPERAANPYSRLLLDVLNFVRSRFGVTALFALLQHEAVARRFGLDDSALEDIQGWMRSAGMHWALDGQQRSLLDVPPFEKHSLDDGLQRLFLGYAMPDAAQAPFLGRLPAVGAEGSVSGALGALWTVVQTLRRLHDRAADNLTGSEWCGLLQETLEELTAPSRDDLPDLLQLRRSLYGLQERIAQAEANDPVPLAVVHAALQALLEEPARGGVPSGMVTFASLAGLRSLPYRVICVIGLNDGVVPSASNPCEFDLMALRPRAGDRQRRQDDRNVFLDLVLAARERLYLGYVGRSVRDNARIPPSILVSELFEYLVSAVAVDEKEARERLIVEHPLQPFSIDCFTATDARLLSFNQEYAQALRLASVAPELRLDVPVEDDEDDEDAAWDPRARFFRQALSPADESWRTVSLARLLEFFRNPASFLLQHRMSIELPRAQELLDDNEPLLPEFEKRSALAERLLPHAIAGVAADELKALASAGIEYPGGALGERQIEAELALLQDYAARVRQDTVGVLLSPSRIEVQLVIDGVTWQLTGDYADLRSGGLVRHRYDDTRVTDYLTGWLHHLLVCAGAPEGVAPATWWHSRDGSFRIVGVDEPKAVLATLVRLYARGLQRPLHFFPKSAWTYVKEGEDLKRARAKWQVTSRTPYAEGSHAAYVQALRGIADPLDAEFEECARTVFEPLLACLKDPRL